MVLINRALQLAKLFALISICAVGVCACLFLQSVTKVSKASSGIPAQATSVLQGVTTATQGLSEVAGELKVTIKGLNESLNGKHGLKQLLYNVNLATAQIARTSTTVEIASKEEHATVLAANEELLGSMKELHLFIADAASQVSGSDGVIPLVKDNLLKTKLAMEELTDSKGILVTSASTIAEAGKVFSDPHIAETFAHIDEMTDHLNGAAAETQETLGYIRDDFKPKKLGFWEMIARKGLGAIPQGLIEFLLHKYPQRVKVVQ